MYYLLLAFLVSLGQGQTSQKIYAVRYAGADIVSYAGTQFTAPLSYASNLVFNEATSNTTMWFLADQGSPNVRSIGWDPANPATHGFWLWSSTYIPNHEAAPFFSFAVVGSNIMGTAYPSNDQPDYKGLVTQNLYAPPAGPFKREVWSIPGYTFLSIVATEMDPTDHTCTVFLAGWAMDSTTGRMGFVVARGSAPVNDVFDKITVTPNDISDPVLPFNCYDVFSTNRKPYLWLNQDASVVVLVVPGRCSVFAKFKLPDKATPFSSAEVHVKDPTDTDVSYVSGAALDKPAGTLWYAVKKFNSPGATIKSFDIGTWDFTAVSVAAPYAEADMILAVGRDAKAGPVLYSLASGSTQIYRWNITTTGDLATIRYASLPSTINQVSSAVYVDPYLYFTTYEPGAEVVRIPSINFCTQYCGNFSWCNAGTCDCEPQYSPVLNDDGSQAGCIPTVWHQDIIIEGESSGLVSVSAVLCSFALAISVAGWYSFWRRRQERRSFQPLVQTDTTAPGQEL